MIIIVNIVKLIVFLVRITGIGGGTSVAGLIIEKLFPKCIEKLSSQYERIILITGTNGKTTTSHILKHILEKYDTKVCSNISGANLLRGIATAMILDTNIYGRTSSNVGVFEVEEATMPVLSRYIKPDYIIITNLFRDQLDAYGEIFKIREYILEAVENCKNATLVLNKDDENVSSLSNNLKNNVILFSIKDKRKDDIFYERVYFNYKSNKSHKEVKAKNIFVLKDLSTTFDVDGIIKKISGLKLSSPGIQNVYNAVAAYIVADDILKMDSEKAKKIMMKFKPAFGRGELIPLNGKKARLLLVKNPASFTINLHMIKSFSKVNLLIVINDKIADGRDISWLWDSDVESLKNIKISSITFSGRRAKDMRVRFKYAEAHAINNEVEENISKALDIAISKLGRDETLIIMPTYTAMLEVRKVLGKITDLKKYWKE